jgi:acyl phosphate:glycerol-3-phosphate acyltransferase
LTPREILILVLSYLLGAIPFGYLLTLAKTGKDIRDSGSGNIGATNVIRTQGVLIGITTFILDVSKAAVPVIAAKYFGQTPWLPAAAGALAIVGHCYPVYIGFRGGKGAASGFGAFVFIAPYPTLIAIVVFLLEMLFIGYVSVGSMIGALVFALSIWGFHFWNSSYDIATCVLGSLLSLLLIWRHRSNIHSLIDGREKKMWRDDGAKS